MDSKTQAEATSCALAAIANERLRQFVVEGFSTLHDDTEPPGRLAIAAACYAYSADARLKGQKIVTLDNIFIRDYWPLPTRWWKPKSAREDLVRAAALIVAQIETIDRDKERGSEASMKRMRQALDQPLPPADHAPYPGTRFDAHGLPNAQRTPPMPSSVIPPDTTCDNSTSDCAGGGE